MHNEVEGRPRQWARALAKPHMESKGTDAADGILALVHGVKRAVRLEYAGINAAVSEANTQRVRSERGVPRRARERVRNL